jgi:ribonuclease Z
MLTTVKAGSHTVRGVSVGGIYTSLHVRELDALFDVGIAFRRGASTDNIFISHAHADHIGALPALLGIRGLVSKGAPRVFMPAEIEQDVLSTLAILSKLQRYDLRIESIPMRPGDRVPYRGDIELRAFRTHHTVPSLGYQFVRRVKKLRSEFKDLPGSEIGRRRKAGDDLFHNVEQAVFAYATDTLVRVLDTEPSLLATQTLVLECSFLDERKDRAASRAGCHIHLDELLAIADNFENEHLVLMHFSQLYKPREVEKILKERCPASLHRRLIPFVPKGDYWPG